MCVLKKQNVDSFSRGEQQTFAMCVVSSSEGVILAQSIEHCVFDVSLLTSSVEFSDFESNGFPLASHPTFLCFHPCLAYVGQSEVPAINYAPTIVLPFSKRYSCAPESHTIF